MNNFIWDKNYSFYAKKWLYKEGERILSKKGGNVLEDKFGFTFSKKPLKFLYEIFNEDIIVGIEEESKDLIICNLKSNIISRIIDFFPFGNYYF